MSIENTALLLLVLPLISFGYIFTAFVQAETATTSDTGNSTNNYSFVKQWGSQGSGNGQFVKPSSIAIDSSNNIYVADFGNNRIQVFDPNGKFITKWGSQGLGDGQFNGPTSIAVDPVGNVYVFDSGNIRIEKFTNDGMFLTKWGITTTNANPGPLYLPGLAIDSSGHVFASKAADNTVEAFTIDGSSIRSTGSNGIGNGEFSFPTSIAVDRSGGVYVFDVGNHRVQKFVFSSDDKDFKFITKWGSQGLGDGQFSRQGGIAIDSSGNVYVADSGNSRIQKFDNNGIFITKWGSKGTAQGQLIAPYGIAIDSSGNVYVADMTSNRIQVFTQALQP